MGDILTSVTDGLKGMQEALAAVSLATTLQTCIVQCAGDRPRTTQSVRGIAAVSMASDQVTCVHFEQSANP